jgi:endonuclease YncB( thermonuclease family)
MPIRIFSLSLLAIFTTSAFAKTCHVGKPCGDTCISLNDTCHIGGGGTITTPITTPGQPGITTSSTSDSTAAIWFSPPTYDGGGVITSYVASCMAPGSTVTITAGTSPITVTGLINGLNYACTVTASNSLGAGLQSAAVQLTPSAPAPANLPAATVAYQYDGDTVVLSKGTTPVALRLTSIAAPELTQPFGMDARQCLAAALANQALTVFELGPDRYGRTLGKLYANGVDVGYELVRLGCAWFDRRTSTDASLDRAEQYARQNKLGLWAQANPQAPWEFRANTESAAAFTFNWATERYAAYFAGTPTIEQPAPGEERWIFPQTGSGLWSQGGRLIVLSKPLGLPTWTDVGALADFTAQAKADSD